MNKYELTIARRIKSKAPAGAVAVLDVLTISVDESLDWVRDHADEIAQTHSAEPYFGLMVKAC